MALDCTASLSYIDHGSGASIDNLDTQTWLFWLYPTIINATNKRVMWKNAGTQGTQIVQGPFGGTQGRVNYARNRATTNTAVTAANDTLVVNTYQFMAIVDGDGVTPRIYLGTLGTLAAEIASYATQTTGSGAPLDEAGNNLFIGSRNSANTESECYIAAAWAYNRVLTLSEILAHQYSLGCQLPGCVLHAVYDFAGIGTGTIPDYSGNGNSGAVTGATFVQGPGALRWTRGRSRVFVPSTSAYTIAADAGAYALTGQTAGLRADRKVVAAAGAYTLSGQAASLLHGYLLTGGTGAYVVSGQVAGLLVTRLLTAAVGSYTLTGQSVNLTAQRVIGAGVGTYTLGGQAATLRCARVIVAATGAYVLAGQNVTLTAPVVSLVAHIITTPSANRTLEAAHSTTTTPSAGRTLQAKP